MSGRIAYARRRAARILSGSLSANCRYFRGSVRLAALLGSGARCGCACALGRLDLRSLVREQLATWAEHSWRAASKRAAICALRQLVLRSPVQAGLAISHASPISPEHSLRAASKRAAICSIGSRALPPLQAAPYGQQLRRRPRPKATSARNTAAPRTAA